MWWAKAVLVVILLAILFVLFRGLFFLVKDQGNSKRTVNSLTWRVGLSVLLLVLLVLAMKFGILVPHGVGG